MKHPWALGLGCIGAAVFVFLLIAPGSITMTANAQVSRITFQELNDKFGPDSKWTNLRKEEEWKKYKGKCVQWAGELSYLDQGILGGISIGFKHLPFTLTYDVLISAPRSEKDKLMRMEQGANYRYKATLKDYAGAIMPFTADWGCQ